tara:strand:+ start:210 stop:1271 length:1062 start_codon:yes stop_codon:yes gene_type:complete
MNLFTADIGEGKLHVYDSGNDTFHEKLPKDDIISLNIPELQRGDTLVVECAHLREAHERTMAQAYIFDKLKELKQNADKLGIIVKLFPQKSTPKARKLYGVEASDKSDEVDTRAIASFLLKDQNAFRALKTFIPTKMEDFQNDSHCIFLMIQKANDDINPAKSSGYGLDPKQPWYEDEVSKWIKKYTIDGGSSIFGYTPTIVDYLEKKYPKDYEDLIWVLGLSVDKKTGKIKIENENRIYTLTTTILRPNGSLRYREDNGKVPYWKYVKAHLLGCKPYHMNQGVIASNYKHWMRRAVSEYAFPGKKSAHTSDFQVGMSYDEYFKLKEARTKVDKMTQKIWYVLREMIVEDGLR